MATDQTQAAADTIPLTFFDQPTAEAVAGVGIEAPTADPVADALASIEGLMSAGHPLAVAYSAGKDSSALLNLVCEAALQRQEAGLSVPPMVVTHARVPGADNPIMAHFAEGEIRKIRRFSADHGLPLRVEVSAPKPVDRPLPAIISGRQMPPHPGGKRNCTVDWKIRPNREGLKKALSLLNDSSLEEPVVLTGTRYAESTGRAARMTQRGEDTLASRGEDGGLKAAPIARWGLEDVWAYLIEAGRDSERPSFSDFEDLLTLYADSEGEGCGVVADLKAEGRPGAPCGARHGCWSCTAVSRDDSFREMIEADPARARYRPLLAVRDWLHSLVQDWSARSYVGPVDADGWVKLAPQRFDPATCRQLLRVMLSIQADTGVRLLDHTDLVTIDAYWSLKGYASRPFEAHQIAAEIDAGARYAVPDLPPKPDTTRPAIRYAWVDPSVRYTRIDPEFLGHWTHGLRDPLREAFEEGATESLGDRDVLAVNTGDSFSVDPEGAALFQELELPQLLAETTGDEDPTFAIRQFLNYGTIEIGRAQRRNVDRKLAETTALHRAGIRPDCDPADLAADGAATVEPRSGQVALPL